MLSHRLIDNVLAAGTAYRQGERSLGAYKACLWTTAQQATALEDRTLRLFLQQSESRLDRLQFTVDSDLVFQAALRVIERVEARLRSERRTA